MISSLQLAKICGVSQGTVDRAIHHRKGISEKTRKRILEAAKQHGYAPNPVARELMTGTSATVGMILPNFNRFFLMDLADAIGRRLKPAGLRLVLATADQPGETIEVLEDFAARRVRAIILVPPSSNFEIPKAKIGNMPLISLLDRCLGEHAVFIQPDEVETGRMAADYLIRLGHVSMLHLTYVRESFAIESRACGFRERLKKQGLNPITVRGFEPETLLRKIRETRATAIFCHNDGMALRALRSLETAGIRVPDQIRIIGVDNSPSFTDIFPEITTFAYPFEWTASEAASIILDGKGTGTPCPPFRLVERRT